MISRRLVARGPHAVRDRAGEAERAEDRVVPVDIVGGGEARRPGNGHYPIAAWRLASTLSRKPVVDCHFWSGPTRRARSLVMKPASTVSTQTRSSVVEKRASAWLPSSLARWARPRV